MPAPTILTQDQLDALGGDVILGKPNTAYCVGSPGFVARLSPHNK